MRIEAITLEAPPDLVRTIGRGALSENTSPRAPSRYRPDDIIADKYRLRSLIARGGMGEVWLATHESLKTEIAIKFSDESIRSDSNRSAVILERFLFEARISARLGARTKHIVAVLDAGTCDGIPYLVMEFVRGKTLDEHITAHGPVAPPRMADVLDQMADALDVAHGLGVIHRDLKPSNVMLSEDRHHLTVKVADFGVAKIVRADLVLERPKETPPNSLIGSPAYMSPEQMRAIGVLDLRSDLWSLGVMTYEAMTGHLPFAGKTVADLVVSIAMHSPLPLATYCPALGKTFDAWIDRALAKDPAKRFASAQEMAAAFRGMMATGARRSSRPLVMVGLFALCSAMAIATLIRAPWRSTAVATTPASPPQIQGPTPVSPTTDPLVEPIGPAAIPTGEAVSAATPAPDPARSAQPIAPVNTEATSEPTPAATSASQKKTAPTRKPERPRKEFDPSEIQ